MPIVKHDYGPRGTFYEQKLELRCPICHGRKLLWMGGKDYLECPTCDATGVIKMIEARVEPKEDIRSTEDCLMALYSIGRRTTGVTSGNAAMDINAGAAVVPRVLEWGITLAAATASTYALNRPTAVGTRTSPVALLLESEVGTSPASECDSALAWSVEPTEATDSFRRVGFPATIGVGVIWTFPRGIALGVSTGLLTLNLATNGVTDQYVVADE